MPPAKPSPELTPLPELVRPLTKSRYKLACECPTKLAYTGKKEYGNRKDDDTFLEGLAHGGFQVGELAKFQFPGGREIVRGSYAEEMSQTRLLLSQPETTIYEAAFGYGNFFIRADVVIRSGSTLRLYEVKAKSWNADKDRFFGKRGLLAAWEPYLADIAFQTLVVSRACPGFTVEPWLVLANKGAVASRDGINQHFLLERTADGSTRVKVTPSTLRPADLGEPLLIAVSAQEGVSHLLAEGLEERAAHLGEQYRIDAKIPPVLSPDCKRCEFRGPFPGKKSGFDECWNADPARPRVFDLWRAPRAKELMTEHKILFLDQIRSREDIAPKSKSGTDYPGFTPLDRQWMQVEAARTGDRAPKLHPGLGPELARWKFPLHFIDFETAMVAIPFHRGRRPYEQVAFQFSHHVAHEDGRVEHAGEWISRARGAFPNFEFVRQLKRQLERDRGTVLRYSGHENTVLCQIYQQLRESTDVADRDELCAWIQTIARPTESLEGEWTDRGRMIDMLETHKSYFYSPATGGSNSIKALLPAVLEWSPFLRREYPQWVSADPYKDLPKIFDGLDAAALEARFYDGTDELREGGAASMAFARMQFSEMCDAERDAVCDALLRYCKLDTHAMVLVWQAWRNR